MNFFNFFYVLENTVFEIKGYNRVAVGLISQKIRVCDMESCYKIISKIRKVTLILKNFQKRRKKLKKFVWILKNQ